MELPRIQYITHPEEQFEDLSWVHRLHENGVRWIQLRIKEEHVLRQWPDRHYLAYFHEMADRMRAITSALNMLLTVNDVAEVALFSNADGLHVGQEDPLTPGELAAFSGSRILGGTINSEAEAAHLSSLKLTYYGAGPLRHTTTKAALKPVLGIAGYAELVQALNRHGKTAPVFAIGGILPEDVLPLLQAGVYGVAVSGAIFHAGHAPAIIQSFIKAIEKHEFTTGR